MAAKNVLSAKNNKIFIQLNAYLQRFKAVTVEWS
jgi:hypothetical protein